MLLLIFVALVAFLAVDFAIDKKILSPVKIFNSIWLVVLTLYLFNPSYIQDPFSTRTELVFLICVSCFNASYYVSRRFFIPKEHEVRKQKKSKKTRTECAKGIGLRKKLRIINIVFIAMFLVEIIYSGYLPIISLLMGRESGYLNFGIPSVNGLMYAVATCLGAYYIFKKDPRACIYLGFGILIISRQLLITMIIEAAVLFLCFRVHSGMKIKYVWLKAVAIIVLIVAGFTVIGNVRSGSNEMQRIFEPRPGYENLPTSVMWVYSYLEFSLSNFNNLVSLTNGGVNYGASSVNYLLPSVISRKISLPNNFNQNYLVRPNFNVSTWFPEIYLDFGIMGVGISSVLLGLLGWVLYRNMLKSASVRDMLLYAVFVHNILMFFFINMFLYLPVVAQFAIIPLIFRGDNEK